MIAKLFEVKVDFREEYIGFIGEVRFFLHPDYYDKTKLFCHNLFLTNISLLNGIILGALGIRFGRAGYPKA